MRNLQNCQKFHMLDLGAIAQLRSDTQSLIQSYSKRKQDTETTTSESTMLSFPLGVLIDVGRRRQEPRSTTPSTSSCPKVRCTSTHAEIKPFYPGTADGMFVINGKYPECGYPSFKGRRISRMSGRDENITVPFILSDFGPLMTLSDGCNNGQPWLP